MLVVDSRTEGVVAVGLHHGLEDRVAGSVGEDDIGCRRPRAVRPGRSIDDHVGGRLHGDSLEFGRREGFCVDGRAGGGEGAELRCGLGDRDGGLTRVRLEFEE